MSSVIVISDDEQDEVNIDHRPNLSSPIPPERFLGNTEDSSPGERRAKANVRIGPPGQRKRRRLSDSSDVDIVEVKNPPKAKKAKREERKAVSVSFRLVIHFVAARADWPPRLSALRSSSL